MFNWLTVLSLVLFLATVALWVRSYWRIEFWSYVTSDMAYEYAVETFPGQLTMFVAGPDPESEEGLTGLLHLSLYWEAGQFTRHIVEHWDGQSESAAEEDAMLEFCAATARSSGTPKPVGHRHWHFAQFRWYSQGKFAIDGLHPCIIPSRKEVGVPFWFLALCFGALPAACVNRSVRRRRDRAAGRCVVCHYNLTGNVSGVCPECGTVIKKVVQAG
jgi:hypothetical protein